MRSRPVNADVKERWPLENVNREGDQWLTLIDEHARPIGQLRLRLIDPNCRGWFEVAGRYWGAPGLTSVGIRASELGYVAR